jgi:hypothetical protein
MSSTNMAAVCQSLPPLLMLLHCIATVLLFYIR